MKNKKGMGMLGVIGIIFVAVILIVSIGGTAYYFSTRESAVQTETAKETIKATKTGDIAKLGVYVRDIENNNPNTKVAVATYCVDNSGAVILDATASSTTAETSVSTTIGKTITCYAFNSTYQTKTPTVTVVTEEYMPVLIDAYRTFGAGYGQIAFYDDTLTTGTGGAMNLTGIGASQTGSLNKMRFKNNGTDTVYNLGGFYFNTIENANISSINIEGSASLHGMTSASTQIVKSTIGTSVSSRQSSWDYVFEVDDDQAVEGNQPLYMQESDYLETGTVQVTANGNGCGAELISSFAFKKGYFRSISQTAPIKFSHENDAQTPSAIGTDVTGDTFYCVA